MKKTIKFLIVILVIIAIACLIILTNNKNQNEVSNNIQNFDIPTPPEEKYSKPKEKYECNEFEFINVTTENLVLTYFNKYKNSMFSDVEKAYNILDSEYREKRFGSIDNYKEYINKNTEQLREIKLESYKKDTTNNNYVQYICIDNNGNYYIFKETAIMQYKVMLDTYTIDTPEFLQKYQSTNEQGKVALNIQKIFQAINNKDYKYAYNCLSAGFKNNYFETQEQFEEYVTNNFYDYNNIEYKTYEQQSGLHKYEVIITDGSDKTKQSTKTFVVKLNEGTEFELSFNV